MTKIPMPYLHLRLAIVTVFTIFAVFAALLILSLLFGCNAKADELPTKPKLDMPEPKPEAIVALRTPRRDSRVFWTRTMKAEAIALAGVAAFDMAQTCHNLATGGHEDFLPTQRCGPAVVMMAAQDLGAFGAAWLLNRTGHHKLAKIPMALMAGSHVQAIIYSKQHGAL